MTQAEQYAQWQQNINGYWDGLITKAKAERALLPETSDEYKTLTDNIAHYEAQKTKEGGDES